MRLEVFFRCAPIPFRIKDFCLISFFVFYPSASYCHICCSFTFFEPMTSLPAFYTLATTITFFPEWDISSSFVPRVVELLRDTILPPVVIQTTTLPVACTPVAVKFPQSFLFFYPSASKPPKRYLGESGFRRNLPL